MIHSSYYKPRIFPIQEIADDAEIDRAQTIDPTVSLNREEVKEIGRDGLVGYLKKSPTVAYRLTQLEYGNIEFWQKLVNTTTLGAIGQTEIALSDFKTPNFDICAYLTDDDGTFRGTLVYPALRVSGFSFNIGDPQAMIERNFDFVGEQAHIWQGDNKYYIYHTKTVETGDLSSADAVEINFGSGQDFEQIPVEDPNVAGKFMQRVMRVRSGVSTELVDGTDFVFTSPSTLTVEDCEVGDVIKIWYSSSDAPANQFVLNDSDVAGILGDSVSIYLYIPASGNPSASYYIYRLQSVTLDVRFDREDIREIGNKNVVARGIRDNTVTVTLGRILERFTVEEVMAGQVADYGKIDVEEFSDQIALIVKVFDENTKSTFKYGMKATGLTPTEIRGGASVSEYVKEDGTLEGENLIISADSTVIGI